MTGTYTITIHGSNFPNDLLYVTWCGLQASPTWLSETSFSVTPDKNGASGPCTVAVYSASLGWSTGVDVFTYNPRTCFPPLGWLVGWFVGLLVGDGSGCYVTAFPELMPT